MSIKRRCIALAFSGMASLAYAGGTTPSNSAAANAASASAPAGSGAAIESQMLAFDGLDQVAKTIVTHACPSLDSNSQVVIYDQASFAQLQSFTAFVANIRILSGSYKTLIPDLAWLRHRLKEIADARNNAEQALARSPEHPEPAESPETVERRREKRMSIALTTDPGSLLESLLSAMAVSSNAEAPNAIAIPDSSMALALTRALKSQVQCDKAIDVIYPPLFGKSSNSDWESADLELSIQGLQDIRQAAHEVVQTQLHGHSGSDETSMLGKSLTDIDTLYDGFTNALVQVNATSGVLGSAAVMQGLRLARLLKKPGTHVLLASIVTAGGTEHDHKTFWTALGSGDKLTYSGGLAVNAALWQSDDGVVQLSEVIRYKSAFVNADGAVGPIP